MISYNSWNCQKCHCHELLITELLEGRLGFDDIVISGWELLVSLVEDGKVDELTRPDNVVTQIMRTKLHAGLLEIVSKFTSIGAFQRPRCVLRVAGAQWCCLRRSV